MKKLFFVITIVLVFLSLSEFVEAGHRYRRLYRRGYYNSYGYATGYYGRGGYGYGYERQPGVKFDLSLVQEKDRAMAKNGVLVVDGNEFGVVNRHDGFWNGVLSLDPGTHTIEILLEDGRVFQTRISLEFGRVVTLYPRFQKVVAQATPTAQQPVVAPQLQAQPESSFDEKEEVSPAQQEEQKQANVSGVSGPRRPASLRNRR